MYELPSIGLSAPNHSQTHSKLATVKEMPGRTEKDAELMRRIVANSDKAALQDIALHYAPRLKAFLTSRGEQSQTAEDIVQEAIIVVWTKAPQFNQSKGTFSAWVYRITRNKWLDYKRKNDRMQPTSPDILSVMVDDFVESTDVDFDRVEASIAVRKHLATLPTQQKQILYLSFFEGLSHSQIAQRTGLPLGTVKGRIRAALKKMRHGLENFQGVDQ